MKILQILVLIFGLTVFANAQNATFGGSVFDLYGSLISKAEIILRSSDKKEYRTQTNEVGEYLIELPEGIYSVQISADKFVSFKIKKFRIVKVNVSKRQMNFDVVLDLPHTNHRS